MQKCFVRFVELNVLMKFILQITVAQSLVVPNYKKAESNIGENAERSEK